VTYTVSSGVGRGMQKSIWIVIPQNHDIVRQEYNLGRKSKVRTQRRTRCLGLKIENRRGPSQVFTGLESHGVHVDGC
jgi:hypothetical protein